MTYGNSAGESRRGRRRALNAAAFIAGIALLFTIGRINASSDGDSFDVDDQEFTRPDAENAERVLQSVAGANEVLCAAVERAFHTGSWGSSLLPVASAAANPDAAETARWMGKHRVDAAALVVAKRGLSSADACTRRTAALIAGSADVRRLDNELADELGSSNAPTREAAVTALGHSEQDASIATLRRMLGDADSNVRLAVIWALGSIESESAVDALLPLLRDGSAAVRTHAVWALGRIESDSASDAVTRLLQSDPDADVRRVAAWALGQILDN